MDEYVGSNKPVLPRLGARPFEFLTCLILFPVRWPASKQNHNCCGTLDCSCCRIGSGLGSKPDRKRNGRETSDGYRTPAGVVWYHLAADVGKSRVRARYSRQNTRDTWCSIHSTVGSKSSTSSAAGGIIPQEDGKRRRSQAEGLPACQPAGQSVCLGLSSGFIGDPPELHSGLLVILSRFKRRAGGLARG